MPFATVNGADLFYTDEGSGQPVLLVHGYTCDGQDWAYQIPALKAQHRVITVDLRGHGHSSAPDAPETYTPQGYAADLNALLEQLGAKPAIAIGHSMGGATVVALAVEHPDAVRAVVPVDSAYGWDPANRAGMAANIANLAGGGAHQAIATMFSNGFYPPASPPHLAAAHIRRVQSVPRHVLEYAMAGMVGSPDTFGFRPESEVYLQRIAVPALAFRAGKQNPAAMSEWERRHLCHPYSKTVAWEGTGHFLHQERPAEFNAIVQEWIAGLP